MSDELERTRNEEPVMPRKVLDYPELPRLPACLVMANAGVSYFIVASKDAAGWWRWLWWNKELVDLAQFGAKNGQFGFVMTNLPEDG